MTTQKIYETIEALCPECGKKYGTEKSFDKRLKFHYCSNKKCSRLGLMIWYNAKMQWSQKHDKFILSKPFHPKS